MEADNLWSLHIKDPDLKITLPETKSSPLKIGLLNRKGSYSNHPFLGANLLLVSGRVIYPTWWAPKWWDGPWKRYLPLKMAILGMNSLDFREGNPTNKNGITSSIMLSLSPRLKHHGALIVYNATRQSGCCQWLPRDACLQGCDLNKHRWNLDSMYQMWHIWLGGGSKLSLLLPLPGEIIQFDSYVQMGWFNHQLVTGEFFFKVVGFTEATAMASLSGEGGLISVIYLMYCCSNTFLKPPSSSGWRFLYVFMLPENPPDY